MKKMLMTAVMAAALTAPIATQAIAEESVYIPLLTYRTGGYADSGTPIANGMTDYMRLVNKSGGVNGVKIDFEECETGYKTDVGVECYERLKAKKPIVINPYSTGITNAIVPKTPEDKIPVLSMGYGLTAAADGSVFPWVFNFPTTYWSQASAFVRYIGQQEGGEAKLKGKKIGLIYLDHPYGKEPIPTLKQLASKFGYDLELYPVPPKTMQDQRSTWEKIDSDEPDWLMMWGWGAMNPTAVKGAVDVDYPMNRFLGVWWSGNESDVRDQGAKATGYQAADFHGVGTNYPLLQKLQKEIAGKDGSKTPADQVGESLYNRGVFNSVLVVEAIRTAQAKFGNRAITGEEMRWGLENLNFTKARMAEIGLAEFTQPISVSCADHEGNGPMYLKRWDGRKWERNSDWITPMRDIVRPLIEAEAKKLAAERKLTVRDCSKAG